MARPYRTLTLVMVLILVLVPVACAGKKSEPSKPTGMQAPQETPPEPPQIEAAGPQTPAPPPPPPPPPEPVPYEQAFPEDFKGIPPIRIGVLSSPNRPGAGQQFALMLSGIQRRRLEIKLRKPIRIAFVSRSKKRHKPITQLHYRPDFLRAAIQVAGVMPYKQNLAPMSEAELKREEVDIFVYMGSGAR